MKTKNSMKKFILIVFLAAFASIGIILAFVTYPYYGSLARGITAIALLSLLHFWSMQNGLWSLPIEDILLDPQRGKYYFYAFAIPMITYWAVLQIYEAILFLFKR